MELLTLKQAAAMLQVSSSTVRNMVRRGDIPHLRVRRQIRFVREELEDWVRAGVRREADKTACGAAHCPPAVVEPVAGGNGSFRSLLRA